jgi:hypothetical protein
LASARCFLASAAGSGGEETEDGASPGGGPAHGRLRPCRFGWLLSCFISLVGGRGLCIAIGVLVLDPDLHCSRDVWTVEIHRLVC